MKKTIITLVASALIFGGTMTAFADNSTSSLSNASTAQLMQLLADLQAKVAAMNQAKASLQTAQQNVNGTLSLIGNLKEGMTGDQVILLQTILANDPQIYPEGKVTGYYGKLTAKAIKRYQKKHNLPQTGIATGSTISAFNTELGSSTVGKEEDGDDKEGHGKNDGKNDGKHFCVIVPPGHLIAPGWLKHHGEGKDNERGEGRGKGNGNSDTILPICKDSEHDNRDDHRGTTTPPTPTTTPDTIAPIISGISVTGISSNSASVQWGTNESALSKVYLGTVSPVATSGTASWTEVSFALAHTAAITSLSANTTYYFVIESDDASGNKAYSTQGSFTTSLAPDIMAPVISGVSGAPTGSTTAAVSWTTNEAATGKVYYGTSTTLDLGTALNVLSTTLLTAHNLSLSGLIASTTYQFVVESHDAANNSATSSQFSFTTTQ